MDLVPESVSRLGSAEIGVYETEDQNPLHFRENTEGRELLVDKYETAFGHAVGRPDSLVAVAERMELQHLKGISACRAAFT